MSVSKLTCALGISLALRGFERNPAMNPPSFSVGQAPQPQVSARVDEQQPQVRPQISGSRPSPSEGDGGAQGSRPSEPPATRLPQHPEQRRDDPAPRPAGQPRSRQEGETRAADTVLPSPTQAD